MNIIPIIRIAAVVGLSAVKLVSTVMQMKQAKECGPINQFHANNCSTPYYNQPVYNNNNCYSQPTPIFESRRTGYQPQPMMAPPMSPQPMPVPQAAPAPMPMQRPVQPFASYHGGYHYQQPMYNTYNMVTSQPWQNSYPMYNASPDLDSMWCNKSLGQMREERMLYQNQASTPNYWNQCNQHGMGQRNPNDIVAMFYSNDGTPLFGPSPYGYNSV